MVVRIVWRRSRKAATQTVFRLSAASGGTVATLAARAVSGGGPYLVIRPSTPSMADLRQALQIHMPAERQRTLVLLLAALLTPSALLAFTMGFWVIASDLRWTGEFFLTGGLFSHWQVWLCSAGVLLLLSRLLNRIALKPDQPSGSATPQIS